MHICKNFFWISDQMHDFISFFLFSISFFNEKWYNNIVFNKISFIFKHGKQQKYINFLKNQKLNALLLRQFIKLFVCLLFILIFIEY